MNKREFIANVSRNVDLRRCDVTAVVNEVLVQLTDALARGEKVHFSGFGSFHSRTRSARVARNPKTAETVEVPESVVPVFRASRSMKDKLSSKDIS